MNIFELHSDPSKIRGYDKQEYLIPEKAINAIVRGVPPSNRRNMLLKVISQDPNTSYTYASFTRKPFKQGEKAMATDSLTAVDYAEHFLKGRFEIAEPVIAKNSWHSYRYACNVLKGRFELGESTLKNDKSLWIPYTNMVERMEKCY